MQTMFFFDATNDSLMSTKNSFEKRLSNAIAYRRIVYQRDKELVFYVDVIFGLVDQVDERMMNRFFGSVHARRPTANAT
jgi:hypothetical protein